jgi:hypothetical protein
MIWVKNEDFPLSWGSRDYSVNVRPNDLNGGSPVDGHDLAPLTISQKMVWVENKKILDSVGLGGVFFYWDSDPLGRAFCGYAVGKLASTGLWAGNCTSWSGTSVPALYNKKYVYVRISLRSTTVTYEYSFTGTDDDWTAFENGSITERSSAILGPPSHFIIGRGYADTSTSNTYLRNVVTI